MFSKRGRLGAWFIRLATVESERHHSGARGLAVQQRFTAQLTIHDVRVRDKAPLSCVHPI